MGRLKIKPAKKPLNIRRAIESLRVTLNGTALAIGLIFPPLTPEEGARARFVAQNLLDQLRRPEPPTEGVASTEAERQKLAHRHCALVAIFMFQQIIQGIINFLMSSDKQKEAAREAEKNADPVPQPDADAPLTEEQKARARRILEADGVKFETEPPETIEVIK